MWRLQNFSYVPSFQTQHLTMFEPFKNPNIPSTAWYCGCVNLNWATCKSKAYAAPPSRANPSWPVQISNSSSSCSASGARIRNRKADPAYLSFSFRYNVVSNFSEYIYINIATIWFWNSSYLSPL
jgi:hypothetical protein